MPRAMINLQSKAPYNIGARCINRDWFAMPMPLVWEIMSDYLYLLHTGFGVEIISFVLMSNHLHLLARFPLFNISEAMGYFLRETSFQITRPLGRINETWAGQFYRRPLEQVRYFENVYKYNYRNPVAAGLCARVEDYPYSTLNGLLGLGRLNFPVAEDPTLFDDVEGTLNWLNTQPPDAKIEELKKSLRRGRIETLTDRTTGRPSSLLLERI